MSRIIIIIAGILSLSIRTHAHTYNLSMGTLEYNVRKGTWDLALQLFNHDIDPVLRAYCKAKCDQDDFLKKHVLANLEVLQNGAPIPADWVGVDWGVNHTYVYIQYKTSDDDTPIVRNNVLKKYYPAQQNRVHVGKAKHTESKSHIRL